MSTSTPVDNPFVKFSLSKEQKEQMEMLEKFHSENLLTQEEYEKQRQEIIDGTFKLEEDNENKGNTELNDEEEKLKLEILKEIEEQEKLEKMTSSNQENHENKQQQEEEEEKKLEEILNEEENKKPSSSEIIVEGTPTTNNSSVTVLAPTTTEEENLQKNSTTTSTATAVIVEDEVKKPLEDQKCEEGNSSVTITNSEKAIEEEEEKKSEVEPVVIEEDLKIITNNNNTDNNKNENGTTVSTTSSSTRSGTASNTIGVASSVIDLSILETQSVDVTLKYKENYGFRLADDEEEINKLKPLFEQNKEFNEKKIERQRKRWKAFIEKHNINPKTGFTTLEEYEQQRIFHYIEESKEFKKLVRKGIPMELRAVMWFIISGANYQYLTHKDVFESIKEKAEQITPEEREKDENFRTICKDVDRTFPYHEMFKLEHNQIALRNVLYYYSLHNPKVGYCQSMNFLAGILLIVGMNVQQAFFTLDRIIERYLPADLFDASMNGVYCESYVMEQLCMDRLPKLAKLLTSIESNFFVLFSTNWFLCLYLNSFPIETALRIWDCFIHEKYKILYRIGIAYLSLVEKDCFKVKPELHNLLSIVKDTSQTMFDCRHLIKKSFSIRNFSKKKIVEFRETFRSTKQK
ncbi:hypothetical protein ABK040_000017 [Willaertia magna]